MRLRRITWISAGIIVLLLIAVRVAIVVHDSNTVTDQNAGERAARQRFEEMTRNGGGSIRTLEECVRNSERVYQAGVHGGFGSGEQYVYDVGGGELYYLRCGTLPTDGCDPLEQRGESVDLSGFTCTSLLGDE